MNTAKTTGFVHQIRKKNGPEQIKNHLYLIIEAGPGASPQKVFRLLVCGFECSLR